MPHRTSPHTIVAALWILGSACSASTSDGNGGSGGTTAKGGSGGSNSGGNSGGSTGSGGAPASGGNSGSTTQPANCPNGASCGGDLVGTWQVQSACLNLSGDMSVELLEMGCLSVPVTGSLRVSGTWTADGKGNYTDNTTTTGSITFPLSSSCMTVSSTPVQCSNMGNLFTAAGWKTAACSTDASGQCSCSAKANQSGAIGVVYSNAATRGTYTTSGSGLKTDDSVDYSYCVSEDTLTLTPQPTILPVSGTIVLQRNGTSPGTGGTGGATAGAGGKSGAGGAGGATSGSGGAPGSGGKSGAGGTTSGSGGAPGSGGKSGAGGTTATGGTTSPGGAMGTLPCDIYAAANNTCVAAHSTIRLLVSTYSGPLYQVKKADGTTKDIGFLSPGGIADSAAQDAFCTTACTITKVYDQSGHGNLLEAETPDSTVGGHTGETAASATAESLNVGGQKVYSLYMKTSQAYWRDGSKSGMPTGKDPEGIYMVTSGTHVNSGCCFDYGNGETSRTYVAGPSMDSIYFGTSTQWAHGTGSGPWIMADMEDGMVIGNSNTPSISYKFVTAIEKNNGTTEWALRGADATTGTLSTLYKGALPAGKNPMKKQGSIVLGSGGDCCYSNNNASQGTFYEGAIVAGYPSDATEDAIQTNIVSAGYGK
jgi:hypothetical protein